MDLTSFTDTTFTSSQTPFEYYPLGEHHLTHPKDIDPDTDETLWDDDETVDYQLQKSESGVDIICLHQTKNSATERYSFRFSDVSRLGVRYLGADSNQIPENIHRSLAEQSIYDLASPTPKRLHVFDYLCNLAVPITSAIRDRHPFLKLAGSALMLACPNLAIPAALEASTTTEGYPDSVAGPDTEGFMIDHSARYRIASALLEKEQVADRAVIPAKRAPAFMDEITGSWPDEPPVTIPASSQHREPNTPAVRVRSVSFDGEIYFIGIVLTRYGSEQYRFRLTDTDEGKMVIEWQRQDDPRITQYPPLELVYELLGRQTVDITNLPFSFEPDSFIALLEDIDSIVAAIENTFELKSSIVEDRTRQYRDFYSMLITLLRIARSDTPVTEEFGNAAQRSQFPVQEIAADPFESSGYFTDPDKITSVTEEMADTLEALDCQTQIDKSLNNLRWDRETLET